MIKYLLIFMLSAPFLVFAQFDSEDSADFSEEFKDEVEKSSNEIDEKLDDDSKSEKSSEPTFTSQESVSDQDLKKLSEARKSRSEAMVVKAASDILAKDVKNKYALNTLGVFYFENKKYGLAKTIFKRAIRDNSSEPALHNNLGIVYLAEGEMRLAIESFKKSVEEKSSYRIGATNLSSIFLEYRDYKKSLAPLEDSFKATRSDLGRGQGAAVEVANNYALALMGIGENSKAEKVFNEIIESETRNPIPFLNYAILLVEVQKKKKDAIRVISKLKFITEDRDVLRRVEELERKME